MPHVTNQERLKRDYQLRLVSKGPKEGAWRGHYLKCPLCGYLVLKGTGYDECTCGNISIDSDMLRVSVRQTPESEVEVYDAIKRSDKKSRGYPLVQRTRDSRVSLQSGRQRSRAADHRRSQDA